MSELVQSDDRSIVVDIKDVKMRNKTTKKLNKNENTETSIEVIKPKPRKARGKSRKLEIDVLKNDSQLTAKQTLFVEHYCDTLNGVKSAEFAGYAGSYDTLRNVASKNLTKGYVRDAINARLKDRKMKPLEILARFSDIARSDMADFLENASGGDHGSVPMINLTSERALENMHNVKQIRIKTRTTTTTDSNSGEVKKIEILEVGLELLDKVKALVKLADITPRPVEKVQTGTPSRFTINGNIILTKDQAANILLRAMECSPEPLRAVRQGKTEIVLMLDEIEAEASVWSE
jgi:phage terminase small subunit